MQSNFAFDNPHTNQPLDIVFEIPDNGSVANSDTNISGIAISISVGHALKMTSRLQKRGIRAPSNEAVEVLVGIYEDTIRITVLSHFPALDPEGAR